MNAEKGSDIIKQLYREKSWIRISVPNVKCEQILIWDCATDSSKQHKHIYTHTHSMHSIGDVIHSDALVSEIISCSPVKA